MSLPGTGRSEYGPQGIDLILQVGQASTIVEDHISGALAIFPRGLGGNPGFGLSAAEAVTRSQSFDLRLMININCDDKIEVLVLASLNEQRNDMDNNGIRAGSPLQLRGSRPDCRMHNPLQLSACCGISKNDLGEAGTIELAIGEQLRAEPFDDGGEPWSARLDNLTREDVGVDDDGPARCQVGGHQTFTGRDTAGQANPHHVRQPMQLRLRSAAP
jgi:hypothetical protein